jgi:hypothetical protein
MRAWTRGGWRSNSWSATLFARELTRGLFDEIVTEENARIARHTGQKPDVAVMDARLGFIGVLARDVVRAQSGGAAAILGYGGPRAVEPSRGHSGVFCRYVRRVLAARCG